MKGKTGAGHAPAFPVKFGNDSATDWHTVAEYTSLRRPGKIYRIEQRAGSDELRCTCPGWVFSDKPTRTHGAGGTKHCRHVDHFRVHPEEARIGIAPSAVAVAFRRAVLASTGVHGVDRPLTRPDIMVAGPDALTAIVEALVIDFAGRQRQAADKPDPAVAGGRTGIRRIVLDD